MSTQVDFDPIQFKSETTADWDQAATGWNDHAPQLRAWLRQPTAAMLEMAAIRSGHHVLDVAAGTGDQTLDIAKLVGPAGRVVATDISAGILAYAGHNAAAAGYRNVETLVADGENLGLETQRFDAAVCRLGLMLFPDPAKGAAEIARVLKPGAMVCAMVFSAPDANPCIRILMSTALKHAGLPPRDPFAPGGLLSLGKPGLIEEHFRRAGLHAVATTRMPGPFCLPTTAEYIEFVRTSAGPIHKIMARLPPLAQEDAWEDMQEQLATFQTSGGWVGPNELLLAMGQR
jgi:SAM-dependent methyltransferase